MVVAGETQTSQDCSNEDVLGSCLQTPSANMALVWGGVATVALGALIGTILVVQHDEATVEVVPLDSAKLHLPGSPGDARAYAPPAEGLALRARF